MSMYRFTLSTRDVQAVKAMSEATREKPVLPGRYIFRRDAANHLVRLGLAEYRGFDGKTHGGFWLTPHGKFQLDILMPELRDTIGSTPNSDSSAAESVSSSATTETKTPSVRDLLESL